MESIELIYIDGIIKMVTELKTDNNVKKRYKNLLEFKSEEELEEFFMYIEMLKKDYYKNNK